MRKILILSLLSFTTSVFGQTTNNKASRIVAETKKPLENDTTLKVIYADTTGSSQKPAYFLNDKFVNQTLLETLNPMVVESINVVKDSIQIDNVKYYGQIHIKTKSSYNPKIISLSQLKKKYTNLKSKPAIFMIDGNIVNRNYDNYFVDENYLLRIIVDKVENSKENIDLGFIMLLTKSEDNIKKSKEIRIRGAEFTTSK